ncbi:MAG: very short patch repair endonuclease [Magnetococcales bacterium]|nr:very short patch repair endonuclease [Magnetococcales bacterium]
MITIQYTDHIGQTLSSATTTDDLSSPIARRRHKGDIMSPGKRSAVMSRIRGKHTGIEEIVAGLLSEAGMKFDRHAGDLPGRPDFVFREARVVVFVDGDFWHGWRFPLWQDKLSEKWEAKIGATRRRDQRNHQKLRRMGWRVVRLWEHQIEKDPSTCIRKVLFVISGCLSGQRGNPVQRDDAT